MCLSPLTQWVRITHHARDKVYSIQHYVIQFVSDLRRSVFLSGTTVYSINEFDLHDIDTYYIDSCKSNYHTVTTMKVYINDLTFYARPLTLSDDFFM
jgi:hypothetical protein